MMAIGVDVGHLLDRYAGRFFMSCSYDSKQQILLRISVIADEERSDSLSLIHELVTDRGWVWLYMCYIGPACRYWGHLRVIPSKMVRQKCEAASMCAQHIMSLSKKMHKIKM